MTHPDEFTNDVNQWFTSHGPVDCTHLNGKTELMATFKRHYPEKSDKQADKAVKKAVRTVRGIIAPDCTTAGLKRREVGADTSEHPSETKVRNLVHNPIENARKKVKLAADNRAVLENNPLIADYILSPEQLEREVQTIIGTEYAELGGKTLKEALESKTYAVYVCACLCLYVSMSLCLCVSVSLCLCVSSSRSTNSTSAPTPHS